MEVGVFYYRNVKTGKLYMQIGGQEGPVEIDEASAKQLNLDESFILEIDPDSPEVKQTVICSLCGSVVAKTPYCPECGNKLE